MQNITKERYHQIQKMQKLQNFKYENDSIKYSIEKSQNLSYIINQEKNKIKCYSIGELFIIINNIVDKLLKVYQISNISKLDMNSIYVNLENNEITFTNIHINNNLVTYDENLKEIIKITYDIFFQHQQFLVSLTNIKIYEKNDDLSKKIQYITEFSNQVLDILKSASYHKELNLFVKNNIKDKQLTHANFKDIIEIPKAKQQVQNVEQPLPIKDAQIPQAFIQQIPQTNKIIKQEQKIEQVHQQQQYFQNETENQQEQQFLVSQELMQNEGNINILGQSTIIDPQLYAYIDTKLKSMALEDDFYEEMKSYFVKHYKNLQQDQIDQKLELLNAVYYYPCLQNQNIDEDFLKQWKTKISEEFIKKNTIDLNEDQQDFQQKVYLLYWNLQQQQQQQDQQQIY